MEINMHYLRVTEQQIKNCCIACVKRGFISKDCYMCSGNGFIKNRIKQYEVAPHTITVYKIDRDPKTGILRYWYAGDEFYYETTTPELNKYVPNVPHGVHLVHYSYSDAEQERDRVNKMLLANRGNK